MRACTEDMEKMQETKLMYANMCSPEEINTLRGHRGHRWIVNCCAVYLDGKWAISGSVDETLKVWDLETNKEVATLQGHTNVV